MRWENNDSGTKSNKNDWKLYEALSLTIASKGKWMIDSGKWLDYKETTHKLCEFFDNFSQLSVGIASIGPIILNNLFC